MPLRVCQIRSRSSRWIDRPATLQLFDVSATWGHSRNSADWRPEDHPRCGSPSLLPVQHEDREALFLLYMRNLHASPETLQSRAIQLQRRVSGRCRPLRSGRGDRLRRCQPPTRRTWRRVPAVKKNPPRREVSSDVPPNKPLKLTAAGFSCAVGLARHSRGRISRGRSLAAIR